MSHSKFAPSSSSSWLHCAGHLNAVRDIPNTDSAASMEGTVAHEFGELILNGEEKPKKLIGKPSTSHPELVFTKEMYTHVKGYVEYCEAIPGERYVETKVTYDGWVPEGYGTSDVIIANDEARELHVIDLKYGQGVEVSPVENTQGMLYALGAYVEFDFTHEFDKVIIHIYQPRMKNIEQWEITTDDLLKWADGVVRPAAIAAQDPDAKRTAGLKQCKWCAAKPTCKELRDHNEKVIMSDFDDLTLPQIGENLDLVSILKNKELIEGWLKSIEKHVKSKLDNGEKVEGMKLVEGRGSRKWTDEEEVETLLRNRKYKMDEIYTKKLISPSQTEKLLGKKFDKIAHLVVKTAGKPTLALETDRRKDINECVKDEFDEIF